MLMKLEPLLARLGLAAVLLSALNFSLSTAHAQGTAFTYQGVLSQNGAAINGSNDLTFTLYNAASAGATVGTSNVVNDLVMTNGLFTVTLDFGAGAFDGTARWLQIATRPGVSTGAYTNLAPRTPITPTPYAVFAGGAAASGVTGTISPTNLPNGLGGSANLASGLVATIAGGNNNTASGVQSTVGGGVLNVASGFRSTVPGGLGNIASGDYSLAAGSNARATNQGAFVWADTQNAFFDSTTSNSFNVRAQGGARFVTSGKGMSLDGPLDVATNAVIGNSTVLGPNIHDTLNRGTKVSFGYNVPGTEFNGMRAVVNPGTAFCGNSGDLLFYTWECNTSGSREVMRINGRGNVGVGTNNPSAKLHVIGNILASSNILASGNVGIGTSNPMTSIGYPGSGWDGLHARSPSGNGLAIIQGADSARLHLRADNNSAGNQDFIIANGADKIEFHWLQADLGSRLLAMTIATNGNVGIAGEVTTTAVNITSDRNAKEQFKPVNAREVLAKVARLPISEWQYKTQSDARHIGPMAQDFHAAFAVGRDDKHITSVDADGVALAAIQGLNEKFEEQTREKDGRIQELEKTVAELKELVSQLAGQRNGGAR